MPVSIELEGGLAWVEVDNPPVNALSQEIRQGLLSAVDRLATESGVEAIILVCAGRTFIAGADIREFNGPPREPHLPDVIAAIADSPRPWIAAIHGTALGGGLEVALGCHYRVAAPGARLGLPEVTLGLIPGAGGTQRLPRLIGVPKAVDMITGGKPVPAPEALSIGLIDAMTNGDLRADAARFAETVVDRPVPRLVERDTPTPPEPDWFESKRKDVARKARDQLSPLKALEAVEFACGHSLTGGLAMERETFTALKGSDQARALRHAFFAERAARKVPELEDATPRPLERAGVVGGGTMGSGIAAALLLADLPVTLIERDVAAADKARDTVTGILAGTVARGIIDDAARSRMLDRLATVTGYADVAECDLVIEAVFEDMAVKEEVFRALDAAAGPGTILATNTSYLDVDRIAAATGRPQDVVGLHFFAPAQIMKLLEIVKGAKTAPDVLATGFALAKRLRKVAILAGVCDGFIGNRILWAYRRQADILLEDGALPWEIDAAMRGFGFAMGPYETQDLSGLDIAWARRKEQAEQQSDVRYVAIADTLCEAGRFGRKTGAGWYRYEEGDRRPQPDPEVERLVVEASEAKGIERRTFTAEEISRRLLAAMINEAAAILEDGIAQRPLDIDMVEIHGYGFPRHVGGPMHYADTVGLGTVQGWIEEIAAADPTRTRVTPLIARLAAEDETFGSLNGA